MEEDDTIKQLVGNPDAERQQLAAERFARDLAWALDNVLGPLEGRTGRVEGYGLMEGLHRIVEHVEQVSYHCVLCGAGFTYKPTKPGTIRQVCDDCLRKVVGP